MADTREATVTLTVPADFDDETAKRLTVEAVEHWAWDSWDALLPHEREFARAVCGALLEGIDDD